MGTTATAQISVGLSGSTTYTFATAPTLPASEWASFTAGIGAAGAGTLTTPAEVDAAAQAMNQATINAALARITANGTSAAARHNTAAGYLVTLPTTVAATGLKATLRNTSGQAISHLTVTYDFAAPVPGPSESAPGHRAFFSTNGLPNSWEPLPNFSGLTAAANVSSTLFVGTWLPNTDIYLLWADDNSNTNPDAANTIDNFTVSGVVTTNTPLPLAVALTAPANGLLMLGPTNVTVSAAASGGSVPATSVSLYTNGVLFATLAGPGPHTAQLMGLVSGTYAIHAEAVNGVDPTAVSATSTIKVRREFVIYTGGAISENFDGMGTAGTDTLDGWYVSAAPPINGTTVTVGDGSAGASAAVLGWNYGLTGDPDRALGTAPTGADRNMAVRILNNTGSNIVAFEMLYDGETWRTYTNRLGALTN